MRISAPALPPRVRPQKRSPPRRRPRFSLLSLLVVITALALLLGAVVALPPPLVIVLGRLISLAVFMTVLLGVIHGRGRLRTFCIGGLVAAAYYLVPELLSSRRGMDVMFADVAESLLAQQGRLSISRQARVAITSFSSALELCFSVLTLGFFSVWIRGRIDRR